MPLPKYTKITKNGIEYISGADRGNYYIKELSRAALRDVAKFICRLARQKIPRKTGKARSALQAWVKPLKWVYTKDSGRTKSPPQVEIGYKWYEKKKNKMHSGWYAAFFETGSATVPKISPIYSTVLENIDEIRKIEGQYLSAIEEENRALGLIDEEETISDDE